MGKRGGRGEEEDEEEGCLEREEWKIEMLRDKPRLEAQVHSLCGCRTDPSTLQILKMRIEMREERMRRGGDEAHIKSKAW